MKLQSSLKIHREPDKTVECERENKNETREQKQLKEHVAQLEVTLEQTTKELQPSLKIHEALEKAVERERESWVREQKQLLERVAQLEANLEFKRNKWEEKSKKDQLDMRERTNLHLIREVQDTLNLCKEERKTAKHEKDTFMRHQERLEERVAQLQATLDFEKNKWQLKIKMAKQDMQERTILHLQTVRDLQDSLNQCEEEKNCAEHERDNLIREREQQEKHVAQLKATLEFERNKWKEKSKKSKLDMEKKTNLQLQTIRELQGSLNHCEEEKNCAEHERDNLIRNREHLEDHVAQLKATLNFERNKWDEEKKRVELDMVWSSNMFLSYIRELQDTVNHCKIQKKSN
ncbi:golgin subfamily A member 6-like protein 22 [Silurus meridionalis]|uniref:golgin subfamily A member 6-like protein 22 n=1 Tax=Silurus meridionalis TaxID=175797 RepID=UPI001EEB2BCB|nr:golgin subfamily A member 6-like protein 22 [Silurus meridionalis]XP_046703539.1 golgin subfamily A member 6-like protein 22 [Silurus meridionalis]